jgi:hypothetical protein
VLIWEVLNVEEPYKGLSHVEAGIKVTTEGLRLDIKEDTDITLATIMTGDKICWNLFFQNLSFLWQAEAECTKAQRIMIN